MTRRLFGWLLLAAVAGCTAAHAPEQFDPLVTQKEIDRTLWRPFQLAFENLDGAALNALYANQVLRVTPAGIDTDGRFKIFNQSRFAGNIARNEAVTLQFWFDSRHTSAQVSYEVGIYRLGVTSPAGDVSYFHGQFHIVLSHIDGQWKIVQDWDTDAIAGRPIGPADFSIRPPAVF